MITLGLDTTGPSCSAALVDPARILASSSAEIKRGHAEYLAPQVQALMTKAGLKITDIDRISVCTGPGSFTGLRVALALAKGLALPRKIPVIGMSGLAVRAAVVDPENRLRVLSMADVRRGEWLWQIFDKGQSVDAPTLSARSEAAKNFDIQIDDGARIDPAVLAWLGADCDPALYPAKPLYHRPPDAKLPGGITPPL